MEKPSKTKKHADYVEQQVTMIFDAFLTVPGLYCVFLSFSLTALTVDYDDVMSGCQNLLHSALRSYCYTTGTDNAFL